MFAWILVVEGEGKKKARRGARLKTGMDGRLFEPAFDHFLEVRGGGLGDGEGAGEFDKDGAFGAFDDGTEEGVVLEQFGGASGRAAFVGALGLDEGDLGFADGGFLGLGLDLLAGFGELAEPAGDVGLGAAGTAGTEVEEDDFSALGEFGVGDLELGGAHGGGGFDGLPFGGFGEGELADLEFGGVGREGSGVEAGQEEEGGEEVFGFHVVMITN